MYSRKRRLLLIVIAQSLIALFSFSALAQVPSTPLTSPELVRLVYQLPKHPDQRDEIVDEIRKRGIGFPLTDGMRSLVATKSGSDAVLRRTLEEAERRDRKSTRLNSSHGYISYAVFCLKKKK